MDWLDKLLGRPSAPTVSPPEVASNDMATEPAIAPGTEPAWRADPAQVAEVRDMRRRELMTISRRLGRLDRRPRGQLYDWAGTLLLGGAVGGGFGLIPFLEQKPNPDTVDRLIYFGLLGVAVLVAYVCFRAARDARAERADTVVAIKEDLDELMEGSLQ
jgi:hypothetical protein